MTTVPRGCSPLHAPALVIAALGVGVWALYAVANGASHFGDTPSYLALADSLQAGTLQSSERTPGYPILLVLSRLVSSWIGAAPDSVVVAVQIVLLAGFCPILLYDLAYRLTGRTPVAVVAAVLFVGDVDVQSFTAAILSDSLALTLAIAMVWLAERDRNWRRAGWVAALLILTRPAYILVPLTFASIEILRTGRSTAALLAVLPSVALALLWGAINAAAHAAPLTPFTTFGPRHVFAKIYEDDLWMALADDPMRQLIADERNAGHDVYQAVARLTEEYGTRGAYAAAARTFRAAPDRVVMGIGKALPRAFRQPFLWRPEHENTAVFAAFVQWHRLYRATLYEPRPLVPLFVLLVVVATCNGIGWPLAESTCRWLFAPFIAERFLSTMLLAMGTDQVGRLAMAFRPFYDILLALALGAVIHHAGSLRSVRADPTFGSRNE